MGYNNYYGSYNTSSALSNSMVAGLAASLGAFFGVLMIIIIAIAVLQIVGMWKVFTKAGEKGWKSLIPFYNIAILFKISGMSPFLVFVYIGLFIPIINFFAIIALSVMDLYQKINLMKAFKASTGLTVALIMVPFITYLVVGFGKSEYVGLESNNNL